MRQRVTNAWRSGEVGKHVLRVLVESAQPALAISDFSRYREAGLDVALCTGPEVGEDAAQCPMVAAGRCELVESADVVLAALGPGPVQDSVVAHRGTTPVVVEVAGRDDVAPEGCPRICSIWTVDGQIKALRDAASN